MAFRSKRDLHGLGWGDWGEVGRGIVPLDVTVVEGTKRKDFIHAATDGLIAPKGYNDLAVLTGDFEYVHAGKGNDIVHSTGNDWIYGEEGTDVLYGYTFVVEELSHISGLAEQMSSGGEGILRIGANGGLCDLTQATFSGVNQIEVHSPDHIAIEVLLTLSQFEQMRYLETYDEFGSARGIFRVSEAGRFDLEQVIQWSYVDIYGSEGSDDWSFTGFYILHGCNFKMGAGDDRLFISDISSAGIDGGDGNDYIKVNGYETNFLSGGAGNDYLEAGSKKSDYLYGGDGDDIVVGGSGKDSLTGGIGMDTFLYKKLQTKNPDTIFDFNRSEGDKIDLSAIDADTKAQGDQAFHLGCDKFTRTAGEIIQYLNGDHFVLAMDVNGDGAWDMGLYVYADAPLLATDFNL